jgi:fructose-bisphosphate aldolase class I
MVRDDRRATCPKHPSDTPTETTTSAGYHRDSSRQIHITNPCSPTTNADPVLMDGNHSIERSAEVARAPLRETDGATGAGGCGLRRQVLKPNMVVPGKKSDQQARPRRTDLKST